MSIQTINGILSEKENLMNKADDYLQELCKEAHYPTEITGNLWNYKIRRDLFHETVEVMVTKNDLQKAVFKSNSEKELYERIDNIIIKKIKKNVLTQQDEK